MWPFRTRKKARPELKQFGDLTSADFTRHPIWVSCHSIDYNEEWYNDTNEETFRPYSGAKPVGCEEMFLVRCAYLLADGTKLDGFATPAQEKEHWGNIQPQLFLPSGNRVGFWMGMLEEVGVLQDFCRSLNKTPDGIFPISFSALEGLTSAECSGSIPGFMKKTGDSYEVV